MTRNSFKKKLYFNFSKQTVPHTDREKKKKEKKNFLMKFYVRYVCNETGTFLIYCRFTQKFSRSHAT